MHERLRNRIKAESRYAEVVALPVEEINGREYAIEGRRLTPNGIERIDAYDLTAFDAIEHQPSRALRDEGRVFVVYPDEGHVSLLCQEGVRWVSSHAAALSRDPQLRKQLMDELEASVDAGGSVPY